MAQKSEDDKKRMFQKHYSIATDFTFPTAMSYTLKYALFIRHFIMI